MPVYKIDDIAGYYIGEEIVCSQCRKANEKFDTIIEINETESGDKVYICDRCGEEL